MQSIVVDNGAELVTIAVAASEAGVSLVDLLSLVGVTDAIVVVDGVTG